MADIIQLLPDSIANQIAAGEVIQRPASVIKELMENAIDAGADTIQVIIKDAGKTLIQVIDNGSGMSETDARISFERHATSKIRTANDLFHIQTKGFRGEALASIAAIAHVEMITKTGEQELGAQLIMEGSTLVKQTYCQAATGTRISVKNLFYNVPARRKFLKSDTVELKHLTDEFMRIVLAHPQIKFSLHHNDREMYHLNGGNLVQRISGLFGKQFSAKLMPVLENADAVNITGLIGKPELSRKARNHQYLFVNQRFIKSNYLSHAVRFAYENTIPGDEYPPYFLFLEIDPEKIDVNIHPTKQEIKFEDEKLIYNYLRVTVRQALGKFSNTPLLDIETNTSFDQMIQLSRQNRTFEPDSRPPHPSGGGTANNDWEQLYKDLWRDRSDPVTELISESGLNLETFDKTASDLIGKTVDNEDFETLNQPVQIHQSYILSQIKSGFILIDQKSAHERILYEKYLLALENAKIPSQQELFPISLELNPEKAAVLLELLPKINALGFMIEEFGRNGFIIKGMPVGLEISSNPQDLILHIIDSYTENLEFHLGIHENLARSFAVNAAVKRGKKLTTGEMHLLIDELFACENPYNSPIGRKCFITYDLNEINRKFAGSSRI